MHPVEEKKTSCVFLHSCSRSTCGGSDVNAELGSERFAVVDSILAEIHCDDPQSHGFTVLYSKMAQATRCSNYAEKVSWNGFCFFYSFV